jgi:hypothetical protein
MWRDGDPLLDEWPQEIRDGQMGWRLIDGIRVTRGVIYMEKRPPF